MFFHNFVTIDVCAYNPCLRYLHTLITFKGSSTKYLCDQCSDDDGDGDDVKRKIEGNKEKLQVSEGMQEWHIMTQ